MYTRNRVPITGTNKIKNMTNRTWSWRGNDSPVPRFVRSRFSVETLRGAGSPVRPAGHDTIIGTRDEAALLTHRLQFGAVVVCNGFLEEPPKSGQIELLLDFEEIRK